MKVTQKTEPATGIFYEDVMAVPRVRVNIVYRTHRIVDYL